MVLYSETALCDDDEWDEPEDVPSDQGPVQSSSSSQDVSLSENANPTPSSHLWEHIRLDLDPYAMSHIEDDPDPFASPPTFSSTNPAILVSCWHPAVILATLLVSWLHLVGHLPFRFCDVVLNVIGYILGEVGQAAVARILPASLSGTLSVLSLETLLHSLPTCPECLEPHPESVFENARYQCAKCRTFLFTMDDGADTLHGDSHRLRPSRGCNFAEAQT